MFRSGGYWWDGSTWFRPAQIWNGAAEAGRWIDDLALWARNDSGRDPVIASVVNLTAPELTGDQLVGVAEMARIAGISASTLRAYISRGEATVPCRKPSSAAVTPGPSPLPANGQKNAAAPLTTSRWQYPPRNPVPQYQ